MVSAIETWDETETLELMSPEARQALARSQDIMDHSALLRASGWMHEDAARECESRMRGRKMDGATARVLLCQCAEAVAEASALQCKVLDRENEAMPHLAAVVARLRGPAATAVPSHTLAHLERCADLRGRAIRKGEESLRLSGRFLDAADRNDLSEALDLLERRRRLLGEADEFRLEAENRERLALLAEGREPAAASPAAVESRPVPAVPRTRSVAGGERLEKEGADWESWLESIQSDRRARALAAPATGEEEPLVAPDDHLAGLKALVIAAEKRLDQGMRWAEERIHREETSRRNAEMERDQALSLVESLSRRLMALETKSAEQV